jgi:hypothetical protein
MRKKERHKYNPQEASAAANKRWETARARLEETPAETLRRLSLDPNVPAYAQVQAAKALGQMPAPEDEQEWRSSVQVRADFSPPTWAETILVAHDRGPLINTGTGEDLLCDGCVGRLREQRRRELGEAA